MTDKPRWPRAEAEAVAATLVACLAPFTDRIVVAGSIRRLRPTVGDIELVYIPMFGQRQKNDDLFATEYANLTDLAIASLEHGGTLLRRKSSAGHESYGPLNKLMIHVASGIPVDLFATTAESWFNYLVCRTGGAETNRRICNEALARHEHWMPYGAGFKRANGTIAVMDSEEAVFRYVGLPYLRPERRP